LAKSATLRLISHLAIRGHHRPAHPTLAKSLLRQSRPFHRKPHKPRLPRQPRSSLFCRGLVPLSCLGSSLEDAVVSRQGTLLNSNRSAEAYTSRPAPLLASLSNVAIRRTPRRANTELQELA